MTRSKKTKKLLIILAVALVVVALIAVLIWKSETEVPEETLKFFSCEAEDIAKITYTHEGESISLALSDGVWIYEKDPLFPVEQSYVEEMLASVSEIEATRRLSSILDSFGLDSPSRSIELTMNDGTVRVITVGNLNKQSLNLYARLDSQGFVYMLQPGAFTSFEKHLADLVYIEYFDPMTVSDIRSVSVVSPDKTIWLEYHEDLSEYDYTGSRHWLYSVSGSELAVAGTNEATGFVANFSVISFYTLLDYDITDADLIEYGLGDDAVRVDIEYLADGQLEKRAYLFGKTDGTGYMPVMVVGDDVIYSVEASFLAEVLTYSERDFQSHEVCGIPIEYISAVTVEYLGIVCKYDIAYTYVVDEDGNTVYSYKYTIDGETVDSALFETFFYRLMSLNHQGVSDDSIETPEIKITFTTHSDYFPSTVLRIAKHDASFYLTQLADEKPLLINKRYIDEMKDALAALGFVG